MPDKHRKKGRKSSLRAKQDVLWRKGKSHLPAKKRTAASSKNIDKQKDREKVKPPVMPRRFGAAWKCFSISRSGRGMLAWRSFTITSRGTCRIFAVLPPRAA